MWSEGVAAALNFLEHPPQFPEKQRLLESSRKLLEGLSDHAEELHNESGVTALALGGMLTYWKEHHLWSEIPEYEDWWQFGDFCKRVLHFSGSKGKALMRIWEKAQIIGLTPEDIARVGWVKAAQIIRVAHTPKEKDKWMADAEKYGQEAFIERVRAALNGEAIQEDRVHRKVFLFSEDEEEFLDQMMEFAHSLIKKEHVSQVDTLLYIVTSWRNMVDGTQAGNK